MEFTFLQNNLDIIPNTEKITKEICAETPDHFFLLLLQIE